MVFSLAVTYPFLNQEDIKQLAKAPLPKGFLSYYGKEAPKVQYIALLEQRENIPQSIIKNISPEWSMHLSFANSLDDFFSPDEEIFAIVNTQITKGFFNYIKTTPQHLEKSLRFYEMLLKDQQTWHMNWYYVYNPQALEDATEKLEQQARIFGEWISADERRLAYYKELFYQKKMKALDAFVVGEMIQQIVFLGNYYHYYFEKRFISEKKLHRFGQELIDHLLQQSEEYLTQEDARKYYETLLHEWEPISLGIQYSSLQ